MSLWKEIKKAVALYFEPLSWFKKYRPVGKW
jgi:hypothetical protein